jgi:hypothetical protein
MMLINRQYCIAVLLILLLSHAALTVHVSTHVPNDQTNCDYCAGHADPGHAISHFFDELPPSTALSFVALAAASVPHATTFLTYRQRAPPTLI